MSKRFRLGGRNSNKTTSGNWSWNEQSAHYLIWKLPEVGIRKQWCDRLDKLSILKCEPPDASFTNINVTNKRMLNIRLLNFRQTTHSVSLVYSYAQKMTNRKIPRRTVKKVVLSTTECVKYCENRNLKNPVHPKSTECKKLRFHFFSE